MLERPDLPEESILAALRQSYALSAADLEFLPLGNETGVWVFRAQAAGGADCFLKLRRGEIAVPALELPRFLSEHGVPEALAPLPTCSGSLSTPLGEGYHLIVYPYIAGENGMEKDLSPRQWGEFGDILRRIHAAQLPPRLMAGIPGETYAPNPHWPVAIAAVSEQVRAGPSDDALAREAATLWRARQAEIERILARALELGRFLRARNLPRVLCHADIHTANLLIDGAGGLHVVDWDQPVIAPKERDLMFIVESADEAVHGAQQRQFFAGYGETRIDPLALAYYRSDWAVQEIADYARRIFLIADAGTETRADAARELLRLFESGNVVEAAYQADQDLTGYPG